MAVPAHADAATAEPPPTTVDGNPDVLMTEQPPSPAAVAGVTTMQATPTAITMDLGVMAAALQQTTFMVEREMTRRRKRAAQKR